MDQAELRELAEAFLGAWNTQDVDCVLATYTDDLCYRDPNTRGPVEGAPAMRRYLTKLFAGWRMRWSLREAFLFEGGQGAAVLWRASFQRASGGATVDLDGMDLVHVRDGRLSRNEVYFDRAALAPLGR